MASFGKLLAGALAVQRSRGDVYWIANSKWQLPLYQGSQAAHHPGLICSRDPILAPGTSNPKAAKGKWGNPFQLHHPESLNGVKKSTFFLDFRKHVPVDGLGNFLGRIEQTDLQRLNKVLGESSEGPNDNS